MVLRSLKADVLVTGHTHLPLHMKTEWGCLVNPGSLYTFKCARATSHSYGVLSLPDFNFRVYDASARCGEPPLEIIDGASMISECVASQIVCHKTPTPNPSSTGRHCRRVSQCLRDPTRPQPLRYPTKREGLYARIARFLAPLPSLWG